MNPILVINGTAHEIDSIDFLAGEPAMVMINRDGDRDFYINGSITPNAIDLERSIFWKGRYDPIYEGIEGIETVCKKELDQLSKQIAELVTEQGYVHHDITARYKELKARLHAINEVNEVIHLIALNNI